MMFQTLYDKERYFLDLLDNDLYLIELLYAKGGSWVKYFRHLNLLCARAIRAIVNHTPIGGISSLLFPQQRLQLFL